MTAAAARLTDIDTGFIRPDRREYLAAIASVLPATNRRRRALYLLSGSDLVTAYLLSDGAERIVMIDRLPFHGASLSATDLAAHRSDYRHKKHELNFSVEPDLLPEVGCLQYLLWELEAMGIANPEAVRATLVEDRALRSYTLSYRLPGESQRSLVYYEIADARRLDHYPEPLLKEMSDGIDCLIRKAAVNVTISTEVLATLASSMDENGLMFVDDQSRAMLDETGVLFCPMSEAALAAIRSIEASRSILFGYNPVSIYQSIAARRRWEIDRRYRREDLPELVMFLNPGSSVDLGVIDSILESTAVRLVLIGDAAGAEALARRFPDRFRVETAISPESLKQRYLRNAAAGVSILGSEHESENFADIRNVRYFVTSSADYAYVNYRVEDLIPLSILHEDGLAQHERIFHPSLDSNRCWLQFGLFRHVNPHQVEAELSNFAREVLARMARPGASAVAGTGSGRRPG